jgi:hypothetical protein
VQVRICRLTHTMHVRTVMLPYACKCAYTWCTHHARKILRGARAGGDVKSMWQAGMDNPNDSRLGTGAPGLPTADFFRQEYIMNYAVREV